jgi:hypothetical protein
MTERMRDTKPEEGVIILTELKGEMVTKEMLEAKRNERGIRPSGLMIE